MKAVRIHDYGGPEVLRYEDAAEPPIDPGDVLVRVHATSVNPIDWKIRQGQLRDHLRVRFPLTLGWDVSGVVERIGAHVTKFEVGAEVYGRSDFAREGAYAQYVAVRETELSHKPASLAHERAAAVPLAGLTAWQTLFEAPLPLASIGLRAGQRLLIHGAAGGVGTFAVQLAKWRGATVIATASARNHALLHELGADDVIDYTRDRFEHAVAPVDAVLDLIGGETQARSWDVIARGGVLASVIATPSGAAAKQHGVRSTYVFIEPNPDHLAQLAQLIDSGTIAPVISEILPLSEARRAHELSQRGHARGKIVLAVP
jgi:NADPH:quinone reductase-like Zn-dependent oxidoreductase